MLEPASPSSDTGIRRVLNVGVGLGRETQVLSELIPGAGATGVGQLFGKTLWGVGASGRRTVPAAE